MIKIRPKWTDLRGTIIEAHGQQTVYKTHAVQLCKSHGKDSPHKHRFADLYALTIKAEFHFDLTS